MVLLQLSAGAKARIAAAGLLALAIWPPVHFALVQRLDLNPWRFFGFAMYCRPSLPVRVDIEITTRGGNVVRVPGRELPPAARQAYGRFVIDRAVLGRLRSPEVLASALFALRADAERVRLTVRHPGIDPVTAKIAEREQEYVYDRDDVVPPPS